MVITLLLFAALLLFILAALNVNSPKFGLVAGGLACWVGTELLKRLGIVALAVGLVLAAAPLEAQFGRWQIGTGEPTVLVGTDPAVNTEISQTVPAGFVWRLVAIRFSLQTDANVANRSVSLNIDDGTANIPIALPASAVQAASLGVFYQGVANGVTAAVVGIQQIGLPPGGVLMLPGWRVRTVTSLIQAGDNYSAPVLYFEQYRR